MAKNTLLFNRLPEHFGGDPAQLPVLEQKYALYERPNLHLAVDDLSQAADSAPTLVGIVVSENYHSVSLSKLSRPASAKNYDQQRLSCVKRGLYLFHIDGKPLAPLITNQSSSHSPGITAEVMAPSTSSFTAYPHSALQTPPPRDHPLSSY